MVKIILIFILIYTNSMYIFGENGTLCDIELRVLDYIPGHPIFDTNPSNVNTLDKFISDNLIYPETAIQNKIEGDVFLTFCVNTKGRTSKHTILRGIRSNLDEESLRLVRLIKFDVPATIRGRHVKMQYNMEILFKLPISSSDTCNIKN